MRNCPLCRQTPATVGTRYSPFSGRDFTYGYCAACDLGLVRDPREDYAALYDEAYYAGRGADPSVSYLDEMADPSTSRRLEWEGLTAALGPLDPTQRIVDFGCGLGGLPRHLTGLGWNATGWEDPGFARDWMAANGVPHLQTLPSDGSFDVAFAVEVVEHLVDPLEALAALRKSLRVGGRLVITTGNMAKAGTTLDQWSYASVPEVHVTFWTPRSWAEALRRTGFAPDTRTRRLDPSITQYKIVKALPAASRPLAATAPAWRTPARFVDRRYGVSDFAEGIAVPSRDESRDRRRTDFLTALRPTLDGEQPPGFDGGWPSADGDRRSHLTYADFSGTAWSDDLEEIHEESSRDHFMDVLTRDRLLESIAPDASSAAVIADLGCSTGYLLEDLDRAYPDAQLVGVDVVAAGLRKAHASVGRAALFLADVCDLPFGDGTVDAVVSANMLEHVADDEGALREVRRVLAPGGIGAFIVPYGARLFDYYDRFLGHERRYGKGELAGKAAGAGLEVLSVSHLGQLLYPVFYAVKKRNRAQFDDLRGDQLQARVESDIAKTTNSRLGDLITKVERRLTAGGVEIPAGIRELVVVRRPFEQA